MEFNFNTCFVCQKRIVKSRDILATKDSSKIKVAVGQRVRFGGKNIFLQKLQKLFSDCEINDIVAKKPTYHRPCYSDLTNKTNIERLEKKSNILSSKNLKPNI